MVPSSILYASRNVFTVNLWLLESKLNKRDSGKSLKIIFLYTVPYAINFFFFPISYLTFVNGDNN